MIPLEVFEGEVGPNTRHTSFVWVGEGSKMQIVRKIRELLCFLWGEGYYIYTHTYVLHHTVYKPTS